MGGQPIKNHHCCFWFPDPLKLLMIVYVDDLLLSGPAEHHANLWADLGKQVNLEPAEGLDRYLGRHHIVTPCNHLNYDLIEHFTSPVAVWIPIHPVF